MSKHTIKRMVLIIGTGMLIWFLAGCKNNETLPTEPNESDKQFQEMAETEQILADLAAVLPEALTDPELAEIVWTEAKANSEDEAYALWKEIADKPSKSGITLRNKIRKIVSKRSLGKTSSNTELLLSALDGTEPYQIYIHAFDAWG